MPFVRCAVYTRKSSEEGLQQSFNSLHAQREACEAYILSQRHEGWVAAASIYDDGGFSGGSMERPALRRLLEDIAAKKVDTVVVYKVDRLTRSLADFAKIVEQFDQQGVSFVSVTQQFNTTTSMGRLTFERLAQLRAVRTRSHRRAHTGQDCSLQAQGHVDGWRGSAWLRLSRSNPACQRSRSSYSARDLRCVPPARLRLEASPIYAGAWHHQQAAPERKWSLFRWNCLLPWRALRTAAQPNLLGPDHP